MQSGIEAEPVGSDESASESPPTSKPVPLILLPGLGGDSRLFTPQRPMFPELVVPQWIEPERNEPLADYAARLARVIDPGRPCFLGGVSFGGVVALEMSTHLDVHECFLIGSIRSPRQMPLRLKLLRPISDLVVIPQRLAPFALLAGGRWIDPEVRGALHQLKDADRRFLQWAAKAILTWKPSPAVEQVRVAQIHGDRDHIFPLRHITADLVIRGGTHLTSLRRPAEVNRFLRERMNAVRK